MSTHEYDLNAFSGSFLSEDSEHSTSSTDKGKGPRRSIHNCVIKRSMSKVDASPSLDDSIDDFVIPPPHAKKYTTSKASKKGGGRKKRFCEDDCFQGVRCEEG
jgi:hypothetical protein